MKRIGFVLACTMAVTTVQAQTQTTMETQTTQTTRAAKGASKAPESAKAANAKIQREPEGYVLVHESVMVDFRQLPLALMDDAAKDFRENNFGEASASIRTAARMLQSEAKGTKSNTAKSELSTAATQLERLAPQVKNGTLKNESQLTALFADVAMHLSRFHRSQAETGWNSNMYKMAGFDLRAASRAVESGSKWIGQAPQAQGSLQSVDTVATSLIQGSGWTQQSVTQALQTLDGSIQKIGSQLGSAATSKGSASGSTSGAPQSSGTQETQSGSTTGQ